MTFQDNQNEKSKFCLKIGQGLPFLYFKNKDLEQQYPTNSEYEHSLTTVKPTEDIIFPLSYRGQQEIAKDHWACRKEGIIFLKKNF